MFSIDLTYEQADKITVASIVDSLDYHLEPSNYPTHDNPLDMWKLVAGFTHVIEQFCTREQMGEILNEERIKRLQTLLDRVSKDAVAQDRLDTNVLNWCLADMSIKVKNTTYTDTLVVSDKFSIGLNGKGTGKASICSNYSGVLSSIYTDLLRFDPEDTDELIEILTTFRDEVKKGQADNA